jgi:hypothetical protein
MTNAITNSPAASPVDASKAPANISQKFKSVFAKVVSTLAHALYVPEIISKAGSNNLSRFAALSTALILGPLPTLLLLEGMQSVKKQIAKIADKCPPEERQPLLDVQKKTLHVI